MVVRVYRKHTAESTMVCRKYSKHLILSYLSFLICKLFNKKNNQKLKKLCAFAGDASLGRLFTLNTATYSTIKLRKHRMWLVQIILIFQFHILRKTVNPFLLLQKQVVHSKWIWSCSQEVNTEQSPKCYMLASLEFCRSCRCYLLVVFWKLHLWKLLIN